MHASLSKANILDILNFIVIFAAK